MVQIRAWAPATNGVSVIWVSLFSFEQIQRNVESTDLLPASTRGPSSIFKSTDIKKKFTILWRSLISLVWDQGGGGGGYKPDEDGTGGSGVKPGGGGGGGGTVRPERRLPPGIWFPFAYMHCK